MCLLAAESAAERLGGISIGVSLGCHGPLKIDNGFAIMHANMRRGLVFGNHGAPVVSCLFDALIPERTAQSVAARKSVIAKAAITLDQWANMEVNPHTLS
jgi:hypothetical protein